MLVHPALNVFSHSLDYALKTSIMQQNNGAKQQNCFLFCFFGSYVLPLQWKRNNVFTVGEIILVFIPNRKRF